MSSTRARLREHRGMRRVLVVGPGGADKNPCAAPGRADRRAARDPSRRASLAAGMGAAASRRVAGHRDRARRGRRVDHRRQLRRHDRRARAGGRHRGVPRLRTDPVHRALRRSIFNHGRAVQAPGCPERVDLEFLRWIANYRRDSRPRVLAELEAGGPGLALHVLRRPRDAHRFLEGVSGAGD